MTTTETAGLRDRIAALEKQLADRDVEIARLRLAWTSARTRALRHAGWWRTTEARKWAWIQHALGMEKQLDAARAQLSATTRPHRAADRLADDARPGTNPPPAPPGTTVELSASGDWMWGCDHRGCSTELEPGRWYGTATGGFSSKASAREGLTLHLTDAHSGATPTDRSTP